MFPQSSAGHRADAQDLPGGPRAKPGKPDTNLTTATNTKQQAPKTCNEISSSFFPMEIHAQRQSLRRWPYDVEGDTWLDKEQHGQSSGNSVSGVQLWLRPGKCSEPGLHVSRFLGSRGCRAGGGDPLPAAQCSSPGWVTWGHGQGGADRVTGTRGEELCQVSTQGSPRAPPTCATKGLPTSQVVPIQTPVQERTLSSTVPPRGVVPEAAAATSPRHLLEIHSGTKEPWGWAWPPAFYNPSPTPPLAASPGWLLAVGTSVCSNTMTVSLGTTERLVVCFTW